MLQDPVTLDAAIAHFLQISSGFFWTLTYILIIRRSYLDKVYGMPMVAICANISWEFIFSFIFPHPPPQLYIDYLWLAFDAGILVQFLLYGRKEFPANLPGNLSYPNFVLTLIMAALTIIFISQEFKEYIGIYAAFGQNWIMSILFVQLLLRRNSPAGQSVYIALSKMVGTIFPSFLFYLYFPKSFLLLFLFWCIFIFDLIYFLLLYFKIKSLGQNPWKRI